MLPLKGDDPLLNPVKRYGTVSFKAVMWTHNLKALPQCVCFSPSTPPTFIKKANKLKTWPLIAAWALLPKTEALSFI